MSEPRAILQWRRSTEFQGYESTDGRFVIEKAEGYSICEHAHPMRRGAYCEGGEEHLYWYWILWEGKDRNDAGADALSQLEKIDAGDTLREMKNIAEGLAEREA